MNTKLFNYQLSIILLMIVCFASPLKAQVTIGSQDSPHKFSILELETKEGGLRLPQLKTSEREALNSELKGNDEARGLVVFDTDLNCLEFWNGNGWISLCSDAISDCSNTPFPDLNASYDFASGATIDDLITTIGDNVKIYDAATGGNLYDPSTALNPALTYYVEQKIDLCTRRVPVAVTISTAPVIGSVAIDVCVSAMYDFQYQTLTAYGTSGGAATQWQWYAKRYGENDSEYQPIFGANAASYRIPANFVKNVFRTMRSESGTDYNDNILFKVEAWNALNTPATRVSTTAATELNIEFIATNGNPEDGVTLRSDYNKDGSSNPSPSGDFKVAYLNLGVKSDKYGYNACDFGDLYQWGRWRDGHEKTTWTKISYGNSIAFDATTQTNQTPTSGCTYNSTNPPATEGGLPFYQVDNVDYTGKFLTGSSNWNTVNSTYQYFWAAQTTYDKTANDPCPSGWHVPTRFELGALFRGTPAGGTPGSTDKNRWTWRSDLGGMIAGGMIITYGDGSDKSKRVFIPAEGNRGTDGTLVTPGTDGSYWSSTYYDETRAYYLGFRNGNVDAGNTGETKANGFSVRCVADNPNIPDVPAPTSGNVTTYTNVMYDFQLQTLEAYADGDAPTAYRWQVSKTADEAGFSDITSATSSPTFTIPPHFADSYAVDSLFFRCILSNSSGSTTTPNDFNIYFIRTNTEGYGGLDTDMPYLTIQRGSGGTPKAGTIKMALLNLGASEGNDAGDLGDFYQWGRVKDGHEHVVWSKNANHKNQIAPFNGGGDATSENVNYKDYTMPTYNSATHQVVSTDTHYSGKFIYSNDNLGTGNGDGAINGDNDWYYDGGHDNYLWGNGATFRPGPASASGWTYKDLSSNNPCPGSWFVPSRWDFWDIYYGVGNDPIANNPSLYDDATDNTVRWRAPSNNAIGGAIISTNRNGFAEKVFLPAASWRYVNSGELESSSGGYGYYWSSSNSGSMPGTAFTLFFNEGFFSAGNTYSFRAFGSSVRCVAEYASSPTLEVDQTSLIFTEAAGGGGDQTVTVSTNQPTWTALSDQSWCAVSPASGTDGQTFTVSVTANSGTTTRPATITVTAGGLTKTVSVLQIGNDGGTSPATNTYVGAFWKHNQTGERIIRITDIAAANAGAWTASVSWYDGQWNPNGGDGIVLSTDASADTNLGWLVGNDDNENVSMNTPADDATYSVSGSAPTVSGTITGTGSDNTILFRIGLQQQFSAYKPDNNPTPNPARYAVVLLSYANNTQVQKIFIRQGEGADYLPSSNNQGGRWSPYNLGNYNDRSEYGNGGFTAYPTQAGYFYQWGIPGNPDSPIPYTPVDPMVPSTWSGGSADYNPVLGSVCPNGYTMPTGGSAGTDMSYFPARASTAWGYYADGFFDRRQIVSSPTGAASSTVNASILADNVAYIGRLMYNSTTNASLFMPAAGSRNYSVGTLSGTGRYGDYWSSTQYASGGACYLGFYSSDVNPAYDGYRANGFSVRCVEK